MKKTGGNSNLLVHHHHALPLPLDCCDDDKTPSLPPPAEQNEMKAKMGWEIIQPRSRLNSSSSSSSRGLFRRLPGVGQPLLGPRLAQPARLDGQDGL